MITIITCFHNSEARLEDYGRALRALDISGIETEAILVDNASGDSTHEKLLTLVEALPMPVWVLREERPGLMYARITGAAAARGEHAVFFDDDNEPRSDYLRAVLGLVAKYPRAVVFSGNALLPPDMGSSAPYGAALSLLAIRQETGERELSMRTFCPQPMPLGAGMAVRTSAMRRAGEAWLMGSRSIVGRTGKQPIGGEETWLVHHMTQGGETVVFSDTLSLIHHVDRTRFAADYLFRLGFEYGAVQPVLVDEIRMFKPALVFWCPAGCRGIMIGLMRIMLDSLRFCLAPTIGRLALTAHRIGFFTSLLRRHLKQHDER
jgi:glycosyltransferase involved in cell wall biosynthesis